MFRLLFLLLVAGVTAPHADDWGVMATISSTMGVQDNRVCIGEGSRSDIGCPATAPYVNPTTGNVAIGRPVAYAETKLTVSNTNVAVEVALDGSGVTRGISAYTYAPTAGSHYAVVGTANDMNVANGTSYLIGGISQAFGYTPSGVTNSGYLMGQSTTGFNRSGGDVASIYGQRIQYGHYTVSATGTTANAYGLYIQSYMDAGSITNNYGLMIGNVLGTNQYAIYQMGTDDTNYFGGKVGIGTTSPAAPLHIKGNNIILQHASAVSPSNALTSFVSFRDANNDEVGWVGDGSSSADFMGLYSRSGYVSLGTGTTERVRVDASGNVGVATAVPAARLHVKGGQILASDNDNSASGSFSNNWNRVFLSSNGYIWSTMDASGGSANLYLHRHNTSVGYVQFGYGTSAVGSITTNGTTVSYNTTSDYRLKENVMPMAGALDRVALLKPVSYRFKADVSHTVVDGFIAHEVQQVAPYAVTGTKDAVGKDGTPEYQQLDYAKLTPLLTAAVQELKAENEKLRATVEEQGRAIKALQDKR